MAFGHRLAAYGGTLTMRLPRCDSPTARHIKTRRDATHRDVSTILIRDLRMASGTLANR